jgi:peptide/nickel transport system substrate-binding protein
MRRRSFIGAATSSAILAAPGIAWAESAKVLKFRPVGDLAVLDPVWTGARPTRNHGYMVFDTLYGMDEGLAAQPQMAAGHVIEDDGKRWTITLRDGLKFHDGEPVLARDVVPSIARFCARDTFGQALIAATDEITAPDDRRVVFRLKRPFPHLAQALAGGTFLTPCVMPARLAETDPFKQVTEMVGSGPFRFVASERLAGHGVVYERFAGYVPRPTGKASFLAGPKIVHFDRVEWAILPDPATTAASLQSGEIDWWEVVSADFVPVLRQDANLRISTSKLLTAIGIMRFNQLHPPFDNPAVRRVMLNVVDQAAAMQAVAGTDPTDWADRIGLFGPTMPLANDAGIEVMTSPRDPDKAKRDLFAAGYRGEPILFLDPSDVEELHALNLVGADALRQAGFNVDIVAMDYGSVVRRRLNKGSPAQGGWNVTCTLMNSAYAFTPPGVLPLRGNGKDGPWGWSVSPRIEELLQAWYDAPDLAREKAVCRDLQMALWNDVPYIPMGQYSEHTAYRRTITDMPIGFPLFYGAACGRCDDYLGQRIPRYRAGAEWSVENRRRLDRNLCA